LKYCQPVTVAGYLRALLPLRSAIVDEFLQHRYPADGPTLGESLVRFNHFVQLVKSPPSQKRLLMFLRRGAAVICPQGFDAYDVVIPVYMAAPTHPVNDMNRVSYILVQVKNRSDKPSASIRESMIGRHLAGDAVPAMPYISIFTQLGEGTRADGQGEFIVFTGNVRSTRHTTRMIQQLCITLIFPLTSSNRWHPVKRQDEPVTNIPFYDDPVEADVVMSDSTASNVYPAESSSAMQVDKLPVSPSFFLTDKFLERLRILLKYWPDPVTLDSDNSKKLMYMNPGCYSVSSEDAQVHQLDGFI